METGFTTGVVFALAGCAWACLTVSGRGILAVRGGATLVRDDATDRTTGRGATAAAQRAFAADTGWADCP